MTAAPNFRPAKPPRRNRKRILLVLLATAATLALVCCGGTSVAAFFFLGDPPRTAEDTIGQYVTALQLRKVDGVARHSCDGDHDHAKQAIAKFYSYYETGNNEVLDIRWHVNGTVDESDSPIHTNVEITVDLQRDTRIFTETRTFKFEIKKGIREWKVCKANPA